MAINYIGLNPVNQPQWFKERVIFSEEVTFVGGINGAYVEKTATYIVTDSDYTVNCISGTFTVTLPTAVSIEGKMYNIKNTGTGIITVDGNGSETIDSNLSIGLMQFDSLNIQSNGTNWIIL